MKKIMKNNPKKQIFLQGGIVICVAAVAIMAVSRTIAWFSSSNLNDFERFALEVSASRAFELSLDGENFGRDITLKIYDDKTSSNLNTYLNDVSPVIKTENSKQSLDMYDPVKDEYSGAPILNNSSWTKAIKTEFKYDPATNSFYVINDKDHKADYIEFDLYVRSETELDIYLGSESYVKPTFVASDAYKNYAITQIQTTYRPYEEKIYSTGGNTNLTIGKIITDYKNEEYIYSYLGSKYSFEAKVINEGGTLKYTTISGDELDDTSLAIAKDIKENPNHYEIVDGETQTAKTVTEYYDPNGVLLGLSKYENNNTKYYDSFEDMEAGNASTTLKQFEIETLSPYKYSENVKYEDVVSETKEWRFSKNLAAGAMRVAFSEVDFNDSTKEELKYVWNPQPTYKLTNAPNGAKVDIVNIEEIYYDSENHKIGKSITNSSGIKSYYKYDIENQSAEPEFLLSINDDNYYDINNNLINDLSSDKVVAYNNLMTNIDKNKTTSNAEDTMYYENNNGIYQLKSFNTTLPNLVHNGDIYSKTDTPATGEIPLCSLIKQDDEGIFCIKKLRVRAYLDGNDNEAQTPLLSNSSTGNGRVDVRLQLVSLFDTVVVENVNHDNYNYTFTAIRKSEDVSGKESSSHHYTWTINNTEIATIGSGDIGDGKLGATVTFKKPGLLVVYATDEDNRIGTYTIQCPQLDVDYNLSGNTYTINASYNGNPVTDFTLTTNSTNVTINHHAVTFNKAGSAEIIVTADDGTGIGVILLNHSM